MDKPDNGFSILAHTESLDAGTMTDAMSNEVYPPRIRRRQGQRISSGDGETVDQEFSSSISEIECEKLQKSSPEKKRTFLRKYKFKDVLVDSKEKNIKPGDHIFYEGSSGVSYYHHLLVTKVERDKITCIDNNGPRFDAEMIKTILKNGQFNLFSLGKVEETETTYAKLKSKNVCFYIVQSWCDYVEIQIEKN